MHTEVVADTIELELLTAPAKSRAVAWIQGSSHAASLVAPQQVDSAIALMRRRGSLLRGKYPLEIRDVGVIRRPNALDLPYSSMLTVTGGNPLLTWENGSIVEAAEAFEHLAVVAVRELLGSGARAVRFAFPSAEGRPREFPQAILWLAEQMGIRIGSAYRPPRRKDGGVDVVGWRPFPDGRPGFPVALAQVTVESRFVHKASDVDLKIWAGWLRLDVDPMVILAIPRTIPNDESWNEASTRAVILERIRIANLMPPNLNGPECQAIRSYATARLQEVQKKVAR